MLSISNLFTEGVKLVPTSSDSNMRTLREFRDLLQSAMGPSGCYKILVTGGGYLELSASSCLLLERLELESPICKYISQIAKGLPNFGLYFGVLVSTLLEQRWIYTKSEKDIEPYSFSKITGFLRKVLSSEMICKKVDFGSLNSFLPLVKSVLCSKGEQAVDLNVDELCFEILKVFLNCVDEKTSSVGRVHVKVQTGPSRVSSYNGLMYQVVDDDDLSIGQSLNEGIKIVIFTSSLNLENEKNIPNFKMKKILDKLVELEVKVVACQKTVANEIKLFLKRRNMLLLERMGTDFTNLLLQASNSFPISQLSFDLEDLENMIGLLTSLELLGFDNRNYILFKSKEVSVGTLFVETRNLLGEDHLKVNQFLLLMLNFLLVLNSTMIREYIIEHLDFNMRFV